ncbi:MAG: hypothetical protein ACLR7U_05770 [Ruthenibacterium lactatiformans]
MEAAKRELGEEAGLPPPNIGTWGISFPPADIAARSFTCMRPGLSPVGQHLDADEFLGVHAAAGQGRGNGSLR